eukprot:66858-Pelagomonas_calceolata.AAC.1
MRCALNVGAFSARNAGTGSDDFDLTVVRKLLEEGVTKQPHASLTSDEMSSAIVSVLCAEIYELMSSMHSHDRCGSSELNCDEEAHSSTR